MPIRPDDTIRCSFCGRTQDQVRKMIAGAGNNNVYICDECIELCSEILEEELASPSDAEWVEDILDEDSIPESSTDENIEKPELATPSCAAERQ